MRYQIDLLAHSGVIGANPVEPFAGHTMRLEEQYFADTSEDDIRRDIIHEGNREFTYSHTERKPELTTYFFREKVETKPSDWALAQAAEKLVA
jgi:hypothetical protein